MSEPAALNDMEYAEALGIAVAVVEADRRDWTPPEVTTIDVFRMARIIDSIREYRTELLDACTIVRGLADRLPTDDATKDLVEAAYSALDELLRPWRTIGPHLRSVP